MFIYQNVCKKGFIVNITIFLRDFFSTLCLWLKNVFSVSILHQFLFFFSHSHMLALTYSLCVPYADTNSYKFHLLIFYKKKHFDIISSRISLLSHSYSFSMAGPLSWCSLLKSDSLLTVIRHLIACIQSQIITSTRAKKKLIPVQYQCSHQLSFLKQQKKKE